MIWLPDFSNRELAMGFWLVVFIAWIMTHKTIRPSALNVLKCLGSSPVIKVVGLAFAYISLCVGLLVWVGFWVPANLKTTILWAFAFGLVTVFDIKRVTEENAYFQKTFRDLSRITVILAFIADSYTFSFWIELLLLPIVTFLGLLQAVAEMKKEHEIVAKFLGWVLAIVGLSYFGYALARAYADFGHFATIDNAREFMLPLLLSVMFMPFIYGLSVFMVYEQVFAGLKWSIKDEGIRSNAKRQAMLAFRTHLELLQQWRRALNFSDTNEPDAPIKLIKEVKWWKTLEKNPPYVAPELGWSPYLAKNFLRDEGIFSKEYHPLYNGKWQSSSNYWKVRKYSVLTNVIYYVEGTEHAAKELTIEAHVSDPQDAEALDEKFWQVCAVLIKKALPVDAEAVVQKLTLETADFWHGRWHIKLTKEEWHKPSPSYQRDFIIKLRDSD